VPRSSATRVLATGAGPGGAGGLRNVRRSRTPVASAVVGGDFSNTRQPAARGRRSPARKCRGSRRRFVYLRQEGWTVAATSPVLPSSPTVACLWDRTRCWVFAANADTGAPVWSKKLPAGGGITSSVNVTDGVVYAAVSNSGRPYVVALDEATGAIKWSTQIDDQVGSDDYGSPVVFDGVLFEGVLGRVGRARRRGGPLCVPGRVRPDRDPQRPAEQRRRREPSEEDLQPSIRRTSRMTTVVRLNDLEHAAVDPATKTAYVGTGNPFHPQAGRRALRRDRQDRPRPDEPDVRHDRRVVQRRGRDLHAGR